MAQRLQPVNRKHAVVVFSSILAITGTVLLCFVSERTAALPDAARIRKALESTTIDHLLLREVGIQEATAIVSKHLTAKHPEMERVTFILPQKREPHLEERISMDLREVPASEALRYITGLAGTNYGIRKGRIYIYRFGLPDSGEPPLTIYEKVSDPISRWCLNFYWDVRLYFDI